MDNSKGITVGLLSNYLRFLGSVLLLQGIAVLLLSGVSLDLPRLVDRLLKTDPLHAVIHIIWGAILLWQVRSISKSASLKQQHRLSRLGFTFSAFYLGLALLGILFHYPMGLQLDRGENVFHILIGSISLILSLLLSYMPKSSQPPKSPNAGGL